MDSGPMVFKKSKAIFVWSSLWILIILMFSSFSENTFATALLFSSVFLIFGYLNYKRSLIVLNESSVTVTSGLLTRGTTDIPYTQISSVRLKRKIGRSYGDIFISTADSSN